MDYLSRPATSDFGGRILPARRTDAATAPLGRIVTDSRQVEPGDVFWALQGPNHDGGSSSARHFGAAPPARSWPRRSTCRRHAGRSRLTTHTRRLQQWAACKRRQFTGTVDRRDRQRGQDHHAADDPHRVAIAAAGNGQPAKLQQPPRRPLEHVGDGAGSRLRRAGAGANHPARSPPWPGCAGPRWA